MYDENHHKTIVQPIRRIGSQEECFRLGFLAKDDNATLHLSPAGMGYLIDVVASDISALPDAYAAGCKQGQTQARDISEIS